MFTSLSLSVFVCWRTFAARGPPSITWWQLSGSVEVSLSEECYSPGTYRKRNTELEKREQDPRMGSRWSDEVAEELQDEEYQEEDDKELLDEMEAQEVMKFQDEGVESQGETESQDETESQMEAESQEETESQDEMLSQMETPDNLHGNGADEVEDMINKKIDKELKLQKICCGQSGRIRQICCRCQRAGHRARECDAERALDGDKLPIPGNQRKQALPEGAGRHLVGGLNTGKHSPEKAPKNCNCEEKRICYGCGEKGHLKNQCPKTNTNGNGSKYGNHQHHVNHHMEEPISGKCLSFQNQHLLNNT